MIRSDSRALNLVCKVLASTSKDIVVFALLLLCNFHIDQMPHCTGVAHLTCDCYIDTWIAALLCRVRPGTALVWYTCQVVAVLSGTYAQCLVA